MVLTVSLNYIKICSKMRCEEDFSFLKIMLFLSFQTIQIMKLGVKAQAEPRNSKSEKLSLQLIRVLIILPLSLSVC